MSRKGRRRTQKARHQSRAAEHKSGHPKRPSSAGRDGADLSGAENSQWSTPALLLCAVVFVALRVALVIRLDGSFIDEYRHVFGGLEFTSQGTLPSFYLGEVYRRGAHISMYVGLLMQLFGQHIWVAKLAPLTLGCASLALMVAVSGRLFDALAPRLLALGLYAVSPLVVFNHFYIRMYAVYETALLATLYCACVGYEALQQGRHGKLAAIGLALAAVQGLIIAFSYDTGAVLIVWAAAVCTAYLLVVLPSPRTVLTQGWLAGPAARLGALVLAFGVLGWWLEGADRLDYLLSAQLEFTSTADRKYGALFFKENLPLTLLFIAGVAGSLRGGAGQQQMVSLVGLSLFVIHLVSSADLQIRRGIMYFMPLYYLSVATPLALWRPLCRPLPLAVVAAVTLATTVYGYPEKFWRSPGILSEINYIDYAKLYAAVPRLCQEHTVLDASPSPHIGLFYGVRPDLVAHRRGGSKPKQHLRDDRTADGKHTFYGRLPVAADAAAVARAGRPVCLIVRQPSASRFLSPRFRYALRRERPALLLENITLYRLPAKWFASPRRF